MKLFTFSTPRSRPSRRLPAAAKAPPRRPQDDDGDAPWLVIPLVVTVVLVLGLALIEGWSLG